MHQQNEQPHSSPFSPKSPQPEMSISLESPIKRRPTPTNSPIDEDSIEHSTRSDFDSTSIYSSAIELPSISDDGRLDWSGRGLNKLPRQKSTTQIGPAIQKPIRTLNISKNSLRSIDLANLPMEECTTIDASQNEFSQLRSFHPIAHSLLHLDLSDNRINTIAALNSFSNLQSLDLSHNRIEVFPQLDQLTKLVSLNLNSNHLKAIPNLSQLKMLTELSIHGNSLRTLDGIQALLPSQCLRFLDLGANLINDLTEMVNLQGFKALESLTILGNNCTESGHPKFSYRPFIYSCVLGELKILDGSCLSEPEIIKGELLHAQGDARSFRSQSNRHEKLCEYLSRQCPLVSAETQFANDEKLKKVIQKRREYNRRGNQQQILEPSVAINQPENDGNGRIGKENAIETGNENGMNEKPNKLNGKMPTIPPKMTSASLSPSPIVTTPKSRQRPMSRFNTAAVLSPSQQNRGSPLLVGMGNRIVRTPISAVVNAKNRQQQTMQQDKSKIENQCPQQKECQKPKEGRKEEEEKQPADYSFTISSNSTNLAPTSSSSAASGTSSSSSSKLSSTTVIISKREEEKIEAPSKNNPNEFKSTEQKTTALAEGRGKPTGGIVPHWPPPTTTQTPINNLRLPIRTKNAAVIIANQSSTTTMDFDNASTSTCGLFNAFSFNKNAQKKKNGVGGLRSVLARKLRRSSGKQFPPPNLSASSTSHSTFTDATATRLQQMQKRVDHLAKQNSMLISVNEGNVATFQQLTQKIQHLEAVIAHQTKQMGKICELLAPTPFKLKYERLEEEEKDKLLVSWENGIPLLMKPAPVDYYELFLNDQSAGQVLARSRRLLITDINPEEGIKVSVQAVGEYGHSAKGEIFVPPFPSSVAITAMMADNADDEGEEGKENHHEKRKAEQE